MAQQLKIPNRPDHDTVGDDARAELMKQCLRKAEKIRDNLEGRQHSDSTKLVAEDRTR